MTPKLIFGYETPIISNDTNEQDNDILGTACRQL